MKSNTLKAPLVTGRIPSVGKLAILLVVALLALAPRARATLLFYDSFDYASGNTLGSVDSTADWENAKSNITISEASLNYGGLQNSTGNRVNVIGGSSNLDGTRTKDGAWSSQTNGTLYVSFLLKLNGVGGIATSGNGTPIVNFCRTGSTFEEFESYVNNTTGPFIVLVQGNINLGGSNVRVRDNKTIIGLGTDAKLIGDLKVDGNNNVIIRNITFTNPSGAGDSDGLTLQDCRNVWVDHCTFVDCNDGSLDISHGSDWITVSWCHFYYTNPAADHRFANLVGHSDSASAEAEDTGKLHITYHHNWWGQLVHERMPRVRFGRVHVYNNFYNSPGNNNCIRAARDSEILVQNNYFDSVKNVWERYVTVGLDAKVFASNNIEINTTWSAGDSQSIQIPGTDILSTDANGLNPPPYPFTLDAAASIPGAVTNNAGAGKGPFAP